MPAPSNNDEFLDLVRKSGVLDEKKLDAYLEKLRAGSALPTRPSEMAGFLVRDGLLTHFQAEQILQGKWRRFTIGKYKVLERLGSGGMGSVYLCEHKLMRRRVAVKVLPTAKADDPSSLERFYREARAVAALDHPNIVRAYDIDQDEKLHFLVMEYVDGASLQEIVKRGGPLDPVRAAHYIRQAAMGLEHAFEAAGLIHRDIKPGNVLVDRGGTVKVLDMGLARFFYDEEDILTKKYDENVLGTADYLAPEQALDSHTVDIRADIYSLGATFFFCLTGKTPFTEGTVAQKLIWHQTRQPKPIRAFRSDVPEELVGIVERMMAKEPGGRYQTPLEVTQALEPWTQTPIGPPPDVEMPRLSPAATGATPPSDSQLPTPNPVVRGPASPPPRKPWRSNVPPTPLPPSNPPPGPTVVQAPSPTATAPLAPTRPARPARPAAPPRVPAARTPTPPPPTVKPGSTPRAAARPAPSGANGQPQFSPAAAPPPDDDVARWEQVAADTDNPSARADTRPSTPARSAARSAARSRAQAAQQRLRPWWEMVLVGMMILAAVAAAVIYLLTWIFGPPRTPATPTAPELRTLFVNKAGGGPDVSLSLQAALHKARAGEHIVIQQPILEEAVHLEHNQHLARGITVEGEPGQSVVWRARKGADSDTLLSVEGVEDLHVQNLTLDGGGAAEKLVLLTGRCPGLTLEGVELRGFKGCAVLVTQCEGAADRPIVVKNLRLTAQDAEAGLLFQLAPNPDKYPVKANRFFQVEGCHFTGHYTAGAIVARPPIKTLFVPDGNVQVVDGKEVPVRQP